MSVAFFEELFLSVTDNFSKSDLKDLLSELELLKNLKPHPNVIRLLGCVTKDVVRCKEKEEFRKFNIEKQFISGLNDTGLTNIPGEDQL